jgi:cytochrome c oxidase, subunit IV
MKKILFLHGFFVTGSCPMARALKEAFEGTAVVLTPDLSLAYYLLAINAVTFIIYGIDKYKAKNAKWRIPEATLLLMTVIGGSVGAWLGMKVWHHKTMHKKFKYGIPAILMIQIALMTYLHMNL